MFHSIRRSAFGSIRIINGLSAWCWTRRARRRRKKHARRTEWVQASLPLSRASLSPIRFTGRQEKADAFAHERRQLTAQLFRALPHQRSHQHGKQNEVHEDLRRGEASFAAEGSLGAARKRMGSIVQDMRNSSRCLIATGLMDMA